MPPIAPSEIAPVQPPFPTAINFPFHPETGIQTSILMSESVVGLMVAATRQNAGRVLYTGGTTAPGAAPGSNAPAATVWARVMVVSGSLREDRPSQEVAADATVGNKLHITNKNAMRVPDMFVNSMHDLTSFMASPRRNRVY